MCEDDTIAHMSISQSLLSEFDQESAGTRKTLERVPEDKLDFQPHPKSMTLGRLAQHLSEMPGWGVLTVNSTEFVMPESYQPPPITTAASLLADYDKNVAGLRAALAAASDEDLMQPWSLKMGGRVIFTMPRVAVLRGMVFNHMIHHRAQLAVYLRLNDVPVPALYGPSADEGNPGPA